MLRKKNVTIPTPISIGGKYELLRLLDVGGMANIYLARQSFSKDIPSELAIKRLKPAFEGDERVAHMFAAEGRIGARMDHPNVVRVFETGTADGLPFIAMQYVPGCQLNVLCRAGIQAKRFLPVEYATELLRQACSGMSYFHGSTTEQGLQLGIVHCDISPTNMLVTRAGQLAHIDFGIAQSKMDNREGFLPGKLSYMSPEQFQRQPLDKRSDIFSLGIVFYEIVAQRRLLRGTPGEIKKKLLEKPISPPSAFQDNIPAELDRILMKMLKRDPQQRYGDASEVLEDLEALMSEQSWEVEGISEYITSLEISGLEPQEEPSWSDSDVSDTQRAVAMGISAEEFAVARTPVSTDTSTLDEIIQAELRISKQQTSGKAPLIVLLALAGVILVIGLLLAISFG